MGLNLQFVLSDRFRPAWGLFEAGTTFRRATGSRGECYLVNSICCECPDYQSAGNICKHVRAVVRFEQRQAKPAPAPSVLDRLNALYPLCAGGVRAGRAHG